MVPEFGQPANLRRLRRLSQQLSILAQCRFSSSSKKLCDISCLCALGPGDQVVMMPFDNRPSQRWRLVRNRYVMKNNDDCLYTGYSDGVFSTGYTGTPSQHWHLEYA